MELSFMYNETERREMKRFLLTAGTVLYWPSLIYRKL